MNSRFRIEVATTATALSKAYKLRYQIFVEEKGYEVENIGSPGELREVVDDNALILIAYDTALPGEPVVGTTTLDWGGNSVFSEKIRENYQLSRFLPYFPPTTMGIVRKTSIEKSYRGSQLFLDILNSLYKFNYEKGIQFMFVDSPADIVPFYQKLGYQRYIDHSYYGELNVLSVPLVFLIHDVEHLQRVNSPLAKYAQTFITDDVTESRRFIKTFADNSKGEGMAVNHSKSSVVPPSQLSFGNTSFNGTAIIGSQLSNPFSAYSANVQAYASLIFEKFNR